MGAAGDMLTGALVSLFSKEEQESFITKINDIGIDGVKVTLSEDEKCGIKGEHVSVVINCEEEHSHDVHEHHHEHEQDHHSEHNTHAHEHEHHHHATMHEIEHMISHLSVSEKVKNDVISIYKIIAEAESKVHGKDIAEVHFHEVGMKDALIDIVSVAYLMEKINPDKVIASPVNVGYGKVRCAHGILPVPAPATAEIIKGIPTYAGRFEGEMCTPTGAAILKYYADEFGYQPVMSINECGYGTGNKTFDAANVVKAVLGSEANLEIPESGDRVVELKCNVDDMTGEEMAYAVEVLFENGVNDAYVTPVVMKKGRSGMLLTVLCKASDKEKTAALIFKHTTTIGIREVLMERMILKRHEDIVHTKIGDVKVKISEGFSVKRIKAEFEDLKKTAKNNGLSIKEVRRIVENSVD